MTPLAALASPRRQEILRLVWSEAKSAGQIHQAMPDVSFGAVSLQLKQLLDAGFVGMRAEGRHRYYQANRRSLAPYARMLESMWADSLWRLKLLAELEQSRRGPQPKKKKEKP